MTVPTFRVVSLHGAAVAAVGFRQGGVQKASVVAKATFELRPGGRVTRVEARALEGLGALVTRDVYRSPDRPSSLLAGSEVVPYLPVAGIVLGGHACAHDARPTEEMVVRLALTRDGPLFDKSVRIVGDRAPAGAGRPKTFTKMPLVYERALGGPRCADNPVGTGDEPTSTVLPNLIDPQDSDRPAGFGPVSPHWSARGKFLEGFDVAAALSSNPDLPAAFDGRFFHPAPMDQHTEYLRGDELLTLEGVHAEHAKLEARLSAMSARARVSQNGATQRVEMHADLLVIDADKLSYSIVWRGTFDVRTTEPVLVAAAITEPGVAVEWPAEVESGGVSTLATTDSSAQKEPTSDDDGLRAELARRIREKGSLEELDLTGGSFPEFDFEGASLTSVDLSDADLRGCRMVGVDLQGARLCGADLSKADLSGADLTDADLLRAKLAGAKLDGANLATAKLSEVDGSGASFIGAKLTRAVLARGNWEGASFERAEMEQVDLSIAKLGRARFHEASMVQARLTDAKGSEAAFDAARLTRVRADRAELTKCSFRRAQAEASVWERATLTDSRFDGAHLEGANLVHASLGGADFREAKLGNARLREADASRASFRNADLSAAKLQRLTAPQSDFGGARLDGADLGQAMLAGASFADASMQKVWLDRADLSAASLPGVDLRNASLRATRLVEADLSRARLDGADLRDADLSDASMDEMTAEGAKTTGTKMAGAKREAPPND